MSVFTPLDRSDLEQFLQQFSVGELVSYQGISEGVENTNYFVTTTGGEFVLTLVESAASERLTEILSFVCLLADKGQAVAVPVATDQGRYQLTLKSRPAILAQRLKGAPLVRPTVDQCAAMGRTLAGFHRCVAATAAQQSSDELIVWYNQTATGLLAKLEPAETYLLWDLISSAAEVPFDELPGGLVHADLFPDNVLFEGNQLIGVIDFYHTMRAPFIYDLAVVLNAWSYDEGSDELLVDNAMALIDSYSAARHLSDQEIRWLPRMRQLAAARFWLSRLRDYHFPKAGESVSAKSPEGKRRLLEQLLMMEREAA